VIVNNPGGHVWFYSPTGIIASPTARFNVGSLILTTGDIPSSSARRLARSTDPAAW
jgi:filamentous hemagglutinin family protein